MSIELVKEYLKKFNKDKDIIELSKSTATVTLAAQALGVEEARIAKTLSFKTHNGAILIITAGDKKINNKKFKLIFGEKAKMLSPEEVLAYTGHNVGGVCPFGIINPIKVYIDNSLKRFNTVFPACGSSNSAIELTCDELEKLSNCLTWIDVC